MYRTCAKSSVDHGDTATGTHTGHSQVSWALDHELLWEAAGAAFRGGLYSIHMTWAQRVPNVSESSLLAVSVKGGSSRCTYAWRPVLPCMAKPTYLLLLLMKNNHNAMHPCHWQTLRETLKQFFHSVENFPWIGNRPGTWNSKMHKISSLDSVD